MHYIPGQSLDAVINELGHAPAMDSSREATQRPTSGKALSVALARSLFGENDAGTAGWRAVIDDALTMTSAGGATPAPGPLSRLDRGSSVSLNTSGVHLPGQSGSGAGG